MRTVDIIISLVNYYKADKRKFVDVTVYDDPDEVVKQLKELGYRVFQHKRDKTFLRIEWDE